MPAPIASLITRRLGCTPAEALALCILALASLACIGLLWLQARPSLDPAPALVGMPSEAATGGIVVTDAEVIVHVAGAVAQPGVYTLAGGSRVGDAVTAAGGPLRKAVLDGLNLARPLTDGEQVLVPDRSQTVPPPAPGGGAPAAAANPAAGPTTTGGAAPVSLNSATVADLETLPGIGPVLATRIIAHRDSIGGFTDVAQLRDVPGIGEKTFQALVELVTI